MSTKRKCAVALMLLLAGGAWWWSQHRGAAQPQLQAGSSPESSSLAGPGAPSPAQLDSMLAEGGRDALAANAAPEPASLSAPVRFRGVLRDEQGRAITDAWSANVRLSDNDGFVRRSTQNVRTTGGFTFEGLTPGVYWYEAGAHGYLAQSGLVDLAPPRTDVERDITLVRAPRVLVRLTTPTGAELLPSLHTERKGRFPADLIPFATRERPGEWMTEIYGSANNPVGIGHFWNYGPEAEKLAAGVIGYLLLDEPLPAFVSLAHYQRVLRTVEVLPGQEEVEFILSFDEVEASFGNLHLRAVEAGRGTPVPSVSAMLFGPATLNADHRTDAQGVLDGARIWPGEYDLILSASGFATQRLRVRVEAGGTTDLGTLEFGPAVQRSLRVEQSGKGVGELRFRFGVLDPVTREFNPFRSSGLRARQDGTLELSSFGSGLYVLRSENDGRYPASMLPASAVVSGNVVVDLRGEPPSEPQVIEMRTPVHLVLDCGPDVPAQARVVIVDDQGLESARVRVQRGGPIGVALCEGSYALTLVAADGSVLAEATALLEKPVTRVELRPRR